MVQETTTSDDNNPVSTLPAGRVVSGSDDVENKETITTSTNVMRSDAGVSPHKPAPATSPLPTTAEKLLEEKNADIKELRARLGALELRAVQAEERLYELDTAASSSDDQHCPNPAQNGTASTLTPHPLQSWILREFWGVISGESRDLSTEMGLKGLDDTVLADFTRILPPALREGFQKASQQGREQAPPEPTGQEESKGAGGATKAEATTDSGKEPPPPSQSNSDAVMPVASAVIAFRDRTLEARDKAMDMHSKAAEQVTSLFW